MEDGSEIIVVRGDDWAVMFDADNASLIPFDNLDAAAFVMRKLYCAS